MAAVVPTSAISLESVFQRGALDGSAEVAGIFEPEMVGLTEPGEGLILSATPAFGDAGQEPGTAQDVDVTFNEDPNFRTTMYRFFRLAPSQKDDIVGKLRLGQPEDSSMTELDRFKAALRRARAGGKTGSLELLIDKAEARN